MWYYLLKEVCFIVEYENGSLPRPPGLTKNFHPDFLPTQVSSVDNPEYHLTDGDPSAVAPAASCESGSSDAASASAEPQSPVTTPNGRSLEDESDHEYYNDYDRLQRELQPLRRNETTVWCSNHSNDVDPFVIANGNPSVCV